jgi:hypothetical protein
MELLILLKLKWDLYAPVPKDFIKELVQLLPGDISKSDDVDLVARHASTYADVVAIGELLSSPIILGVNQQRIFSARLAKSGFQITDFVCGKIGDNLLDLHDFQRPYFFKTDRPSIFFDTNF